MLIIMDLDSPREDVEKVKKKIEAHDCTAHEIPGDSRLAIGITGPMENIKEEDFQVLPSVAEVIRVTKKYKLVSRLMKNEDTVFAVNGHQIGGKELTIIAGPGAVESRDQIFNIAGKLKELGVNFLRGGAYKQRSSPYAFQGLKEKGLEYLAEVKKEFGLGIVTEALNQMTVPLAAVACGADGLIIEVHTHPELALSDGYQTINPEKFKELLDSIKQMAPIVNRKLS